MKKTKDWLTENWYYCAIAIMLLIATRNLPYGYYQILRIFTFVIGIAGAYQSYKKDRIFWLWVIGAITVIFNPVLPLYFSKNTWTIVDVIAGITFLAFVFFANSQNWHPIAEIREDLKKNWRIYFSVNVFRLKRFWLLTFIISCFMFIGMKHSEIVCLQQVQSIDPHEYVKDMSDDQIANAARYLQMDVNKLLEIRFEENARYMNRGIFQGDYVTDLSEAYNEDIYPDELNQYLREQCKIF